jgi:hypothetical protein
LRILLVALAALAALVATSGGAFHAPVHDLALAPADVTTLGADGGDTLGAAVAAGDFNGDGIEDLLLGASSADAAGNAKVGAGEAYVIFGSTTLGGTKDIFASAQDLTVLGAGAGDNLGEAVAAGDFNGDGIDDLLLGAFSADAAGNAKPFAGEAYVIFGSTTLSGTKDIAAGDQDLIVLGADGGDFLGSSVAAGDFNGDGIDDLLLGAFNAAAAGNAKPFAGEAYVIFGSTTLSGTKNIAASDQDFTVLGGDAVDRLAISVAAGDFNGDGFDDLLLGANGGDGFIENKPNAGEAYVIFGNPLLGGTADLFAGGLFIPFPLWVLGADANDRLGAAVAAGDFNRDGIDDLLLGAFGADAAGNGTACGAGEVGDKCDAGEAYVIFGDPIFGDPFLAQIRKDIATNDQDLIVLGAGAGDSMGGSVGAGDFNGDGIDDLLLGAFSADADAGDLLSISVAAGDFNGDSIDDLLLGAFSADAGGNGTACGAGQVGDKCGAGEAYVIFAVDSDSDGDGMPNSFELANPCLDPLVAEAGVDPDFDGLANVTEFGIGTNPCDADTDGDAFSASTDPCPLLAEDFDGFQDADGCPDPDNDLDGICDPGQTSVSCTGSDSGQTVFDPAGTIPSPTIDCRNMPEDYDGFKDSDGCPEPDNDNDAFSDVIDDCPGSGAVAGADGMLGSPEDLNHNGISDGGESALTSDDSTLTFEDYDGVLDTDGCHDSPGDDFDGDSLGLGDPFGLFFRDEVEVFMGTLPGFACAATPDTDDEDPDATGTDWDDSQDTDGSDLFLFAQRFGTEKDVPPPVGKLPYIQRSDIYPTDVSLHKIDGSDLFVLASYFGDSCP